MRVGAWAVLALAGLVAGGARGAEPLGLRADVERAPFLHGVASADPLADSVLIWTRATPPAGRSEDLAVRWALWRRGEAGASFAEPLRSGSALLSEEADWTLTVDVRGLAARTDYEFQFEDAAGRRSALGRTRTAGPGGDVVRLAVTSCTSVWSGFLNVYREMAARDDLDAVLHLGDYIYPEVDQDEMVRIPAGLCKHKWFGAAGGVGRAEDNAEESVSEAVRALNCSAPDLHRYRWVHAFILLDPDLRAARARHPFISVLDNHDLSGRDAALGGSRQAALEWMPMRATVKDGRVESVRTLRYGDDLLDLILLDTYTYTDSTSAGLLGDGQHAWLDEALAASNTTWRILASAKQFMPFTLNGVPHALNVPMAVAFTTLLALLGSCIGVEVCLVSRRRAHLRSRGSSGEVKDVDVGAETGGPLESKSLARRLRAGHREAPCGARACTSFGACALVLMCLAWVVAIPLLAGSLDSGEGLSNLDGDSDTWEGQPAARNRLFDQLKEHDVARDNIFCTGDMHMSVAADVVRFDAASKDLLDYDPAATSAEVERFGVEMLPSSGSRGNADEMIKQLSGFVTPHSALANFMVAVGNYAVAAANPHFRFFESSEHGFGLLELSAEQVVAQFWHVPILAANQPARLAKTLVSRAGAGQWAEQKNV